MDLNWTPEVFSSFIGSLTGLICVIFTYKSSRTRKIRSLNYIRLSWIFSALFLFLDGASTLYLNIPINLIAVIVLFPSTLLIIIAINYITKESYLSVSLVFIFGAGILLCYLAFQPGSVIQVVEMGYLKLEWTGLFQIIAIFFELVNIFYIFYWGLRTWNNAPYSIKRDANQFFIGILFLCIISVLFYFLNFWIPILIIFSDGCIAIGLLIIAFAIVREPKLLYILPFTLNRLLVKDRNGFPLYDYDWSESNVNETLFTGFINAIQVMSTEIIKLGGVVDVNLKEGILILHDSEYITVGIVASKSSKLLKNALSQFIRDFEFKFLKELEESIIDMTAYASAVELIEKYFSNFPIRIKQHEQPSLLISSKHASIPLELENKLTNIFPDENDLEVIKSELIRAPFGSLDDFLKLHKELKKEVNLSSNQEQ